MADLRAAKPVSRSGAAEQDDDADLVAYLAFIAASPFMFPVHYRGAAGTIVGRPWPLAMSDGCRPSHAVHATSRGCLLCGDVADHQVEEEHRSCVPPTQRQDCLSVMEAGSRRRRVDFCLQQKDFDAFVSCCPE